MIQLWESDCHIHETTKDDIEGRNESILTKQKRVLLLETWQVSPSPWLILRWISVAVQKRFSLVTAVKRNCCRHETNRSCCRVQPRIPPSKYLSHSQIQVRLSSNLSEQKREHQRGMQNNRRREVWDTKKTMRGHLEYNDTLWWEEYWTNGRTWRQNNGDIIVLACNFVSFVGHTGFDSHVRHSYSIWYLHDGCLLQFVYSDIFVMKKTCRSQFSRLTYMYFRWLFDVGYELRGGRSLHLHVSSLFGPCNSCEREMELSGNTLIKQRKIPSGCFITRISSRERQGRNVINFPA